MALMSRHEIAKAFGYNLRTSLDAAFISERDRNDPKAVKDDLAKITNAGDVIMYAHDAQAFMVATLISQAPK